VINVQELLDSGVHFGHRTSRWNPKMAPYLRGKRNTIHIIDLKATVRGLVRAEHFLRAVTGEGYDVLFVGTKRSAKNVIREEAMRCEMPFVTERWLGGCLTNFETIRGRLQRLEELESLEETGEVQAMSKKAQARHGREKRKLLKNLAGIRNMSSLPGAVVIVDPRREHIATREANRCNIPIISLVDSDCDPDPIDIPIPANDDAMRSVSILLGRLADACMTGKRAAKSRAAEVRRGMEVDQSTQAAIAEATGEAGRRGPSKKVVVRRASADAPKPADAAAPAETPAEPAAPAAEPAAETPPEPTPETPAEGGETKE
jgi:small subunit ribosomal protein S2